MKGTVEQVFFMDEYFPNPLTVKLKLDYLAVVP